jgi:predicted nucleic acid-binding protein
MNPSVVGVAVDCATAVELLSDLVAHPDHHFVDAAPTIAQSSFDELTARITGYRQVSDATLLHVARAAGFKLVTLDAAVSHLCPWNENLSVLVPGR